MKTAITVLFLLSTLVNSAAAQGSATMTIRATVVANTTFSTDVSGTNAVVSSEGYTPFGLTVTAQTPSGDIDMNNVTLSSDETVLAQGVSTPSQRRRIEIEYTQLSAKPASYTVTVQYF